MNDLKLSLCITNYNRTMMLLESFEKVIRDPRITEVIICDDHSNNDTIYDLMVRLSEESSKYEKVIMYTHPTNVGMYENKKRAIEYASNEWCIMFDSDNMIDSSYIDAFSKWFGVDTSQKGISTIYCPEFAKPQFDYRNFAKLYYGKWNAGNLLKDPLFECLLNTCNYVVNKTDYLRVWEPSNLTGAADSIYFMYLWLKSGNNFFVVPDMQYYHRVHDGSGFMQDVNGNMQKAKQVKELIKLL